MVEELLNLHRGQGMDLFWRDSLTCPTEEEYVQMVLGSECRGSALGWGPQVVYVPADSAETGGLFRIAVKLMMARSGSDV